MTLDLVYTVTGILVPIIGAVVAIKIIHAAFKHH